MSITGIINRFFDTTVNVQRRTTARTSTGDLSETWNTIAANVRATIQPLSISEESALNQGKEFVASFKAYMPDDVVVIKNGDRIVDIQSTKTHEVVSVQNHHAARSDIVLGHHYKLYLQTPRDTKS